MIQCFLVLFIGIYKKFSTLHNLQSYIGFSGFLYCFREYSKNNCCFYLCLSPCLIRFIVAVTACTYKRHQKAICHLFRQTTLYKQM